MPHCARLSLTGCLPAPCKLCEWPNVGHFVPIKHKVTSGTKRPGYETTWVRKYVILGTKWLGYEVTWVRSSLLSRPSWLGQLRRAAIPSDWKGRPRHSARARGLPLHSLRCLQSCPGHEGLKGRVRSDLGTKWPTPEWPLASGNMSLYMIYSFPSHPQ